MCRHLGWLGEPRSLHDLVLAPPHGLLVQSYAPRRQRFGRVNADGWGVAFAPTPEQDRERVTEQRPTDQPVARWRSSRPLWQDASFASLAPVLRSGCVVAAVRSATVGMPIEDTAVAPFLHDGWWVSLNGRIDPAVLPRRPEAESVCDAALLAAHVVAQGVERLGETVVELGRHDPAARLNLLLADGDCLMATTWGDTLSVLTTDAGTVLASEPYDGIPGWTDVPDRHLVVVTRDGVTLSPLESDA